MDRLAPFFEQFSLSARMFYSGAFCGISPNLDEQAGYLHVLKKGRLTITHPKARPVIVDTPSIIFLPRPHKHPETSWSLEQLAQHAGMSRARFAAHFRKIVGITPFDYLTNWRLGIAQTMLRKGNSLKLIATAVGYTNATALTRVFTQRLGTSPTEWLA